MNAVYPEDFYVRYVDACNSHTKGLVYIAAIYHEVVEPYETLSPYLIELDLKGMDSNCKIMIDGSKMGDKYKSNYDCLCQDLNGFVYIGTEDGFIKYDGKDLEFVDVIFPNKRRGSIRCAHAIANDVFFGDSEGGVICYSEGRLIRSQLNKVDVNPNWINGVHGVYDCSVIAVGVGGLVAKYINSEWEVIPSPANIWLNAVCVVEDKVIYVAGKLGFAWRWDRGSRWVRLEAEKNDEYDVRFMDFAWYENVLYAAASRDGVYRLEGDVFVRVEEVGDAYVSKLSITDSGLVGLGNVWGSSGSWITHFDGQKWAAHQININLPQIS